MKPYKFLFILGEISLGVTMILFILCMIGQGFVICTSKTKSSSHMIDKVFDYAIRCGCFAVVSCAVSGALYLIDKAISWICTL